MKRMKKIFSYAELLIKYELLKREEIETLKKLDRYELENQTLRMCLKNEEQRTVSFRRNYRNKLNEYEDLMNSYNNLLEEKEKIERKNKNGKNNNIKKSNSESKN